MTKIEVIDWMREYLDGDSAKQSAFGMIMQDIGEFGFEQWLELPAEVIVASYVEVTEEVSKELVRDLGNLLSQEDELAELGVEQSMRIETLESIEGFREGMMSIMRSLLSYLEVREQAQALYEYEN